MLAQKPARSLGELSAEDRFKYYLDSINSQVDAIAEDMVTETHEQHGPDAAVPIEAYASVLTRGGKRLRGILALSGYEFLASGDRNSEVAVDAASIVEMLHAYMLVTDDIQDRSRTRRGGPSAHHMIENDSIANDWAGNPQDNGNSLGINAAIIPLKYALARINELDVPNDAKIRASSMIYSTMIATGHGQTLDIFSQLKKPDNLADARQNAEKVMLLKTAHYSIQMPLQFGMILAGAKSEKNLQLIEPYAEHAGRAYQIRDDLLPYVSEDSGKDHGDDLREGKLNLVIISALERLDAKDGAYLRSCLGNRDLTEAQFQRCKRLILGSGLIDDLTAEAQQSVDKAIQELADLPPYFNQNVVRFLSYLTKKFIVRDK